MTFNDLKRLKPCTQALKWAEKYAENPQQGWEKCSRGDRMLWLLIRTKDRKQVMLTVCKCARLAMKHIPDNEDHPRIAVETVEAWCRGEVVLDEVKKAAAAIYATVNVANTADNAAEDNAVHVATAAESAAAAIYATIYAAASDSVAYASASVATAASKAASADYAAADANEADVARARTFKQCADIVREDWPNIP